MRAGKVLHWGKLRVCEKKTYFVSDIHTGNDVNRITGTSIYVLCAFTGHGKQWH